MADNSANVRIGYAGKVYYAPLGTTGPTDLTSAWADTWIDLGLISADDGISESKDESRDSYYALGYDSPVRIQKKQSTQTFKLTFIETNPDVLALYHDVTTGDMTAAGTGETAYVKFTQSQNNDINEYALGVDIIDGATRARFLMPRVMVSDKGDVVYKNDTLVGYDLTFTALLSSDNITMQRMYGGLVLPTPPDEG